jgi:hypothetical protein
MRLSSSRRIININQALLCEDADLKFPEPSAKNIELFDKDRVATIGWVDLPQGGFKNATPRLRVELYEGVSRVYGPIMLSFNAIVPENMRMSKTLAQAHLTTMNTIELIALLAMAVKKTMPALTLRDIWLQAEQFIQKIKV